jgi:hypothetical protein
MNMRSMMRFCPNHVFRSLSRVSTPYLQEWAKEIIPTSTPAPPLLNDLESLVRYNASVKTPPAFARALREAAAGHGVVPRLVSDAPEEWRLGPLTVRVDRARGRAVVRYARLPVAAAVASEPTAILAACKRVWARLCGRSVEPARLAAALARAYARVARAGERAAIARVWPEVARDVGGRYPRAQLAFDIARLRRARHLVHDGHRIDFAVATGGAARTKRAVLWVEDERGSGQFYMYFRLLPVAPRSSKERT